MGVVKGRVFTKNDEPLSSQPCGCDPGHQTHSVLGYHCEHYPNCAWGKAETLKQTVPAVATPERVVMGIGGAPMRPTTLPEAPVERKKYPVASGVLDYFPDAIVALSHLSWMGNEQHNPGKPLHWDRSKSADESDTMLRHFMQRGTRDKDGVRHSVKVVWRALALLQKEIEAEQATSALGSVLRNEEDYL